MGQFTEPCVLLLQAFQRRLKQYLFKDGHRQPARPNGANGDPVRGGLALYASAKRDFASMSVFGCRRSVGVFRVLVRED